MRKSFFSFGFCAMLFAFGFPAQGQQPAKVPRIGFVSVSGDPTNPGRYVEALRQGLRDLGYNEGKNILVEYRYLGEGPDRVPGFVAELVQLKVDVLISSSTGAIRAAKQATKTIPIVWWLLLIRSSSGWSKVWRAPVEISPGLPDLPES